MPFDFPFWLLSIVIFCTCETRKNLNSVSKFKCPLSRTPIKFREFAELAGKSKIGSQYWTPCVSSDYSCAKIKIHAAGHVFACIPDYGLIRPAFFGHNNSTDSLLVKYEDFVTLTKGCEFLKDEVVGRTKTTAVFQNVTFVTDLKCCKGDDCHGSRWRKIWTDHELGGDHGNMFWYASIIFTSTFFSLIVMKSSLVAYQKLRERLVINALKSIHPELKQADEEDRSKRPSTVSRIFPFVRRRRKAARKGSSSDLTASTTKRLLKLTHKKGS